MSFYHDKKNVADYIKMAEGYDGQALITFLEPNLAHGSTVLELGMGPGKDLALLARYYQVTGSDYSNMFIEHYRASNPDADVLNLDATTLDTPRTFDCIYSNKVLHHLTQDQLAQSFAQQAQRLNSGGIVAHSFWYGDAEGDHNGVHYVYYTLETLRPLFEPHFEVVATELSAEMETDDTIHVVLRL